MAQRIGTTSGAQTILVVPEQLRADAAQLRALAEEDAGYIQGLANLVTSIGEVWKGDSETAFVEKFKELQKAFDGFYELLNLQAEMLDGTATRMETADQTLAQRISSIP